MNRIGIKTVDRWNSGIRVVHRGFYITCRDHPAFKWFIARGSVNPGLVVRTVIHGGIVATREINARPVFSLVNFGTGVKHWTFTIRIECRMVTPLVTRPLGVLGHLNSHIGFRR
jgi:hypothetical protein